MNHWLSNFIDMSLTFECFLSILTPVIWKNEQVIRYSFNSFDHDHDGILNQEEAEECLYIWLGETPMLEYKSITLSHFYEICSQFPSFLYTLNRLPYTLANFTLGSCVWSHLTSSNEFPTSISS